MKLETAYRKLGKHRKRWDVRVQFEEGLQLVVKAGWRGQWKDENNKPLFPEELRGEIQDCYGSRYWVLAVTGHANAVSAMASKLDRVESAIQAHQAAKELIKEAAK